MSATDEAGPRDGADGRRRSRSRLLAGAVAVGSVAVGAAIWTLTSGARQGDGDPGSETAAAVAETWARGWEDDDGPAVAAVFAEDGSYEDFSGTRVSTEDMARFVSRRSEDIVGVQRVGELTWLGTDDDGHDVHSWVQQFDWVGEPTETFRGVMEVALDRGLASRVEWVSDAYTVAGGPAGSAGGSDAAVEAAADLAERWSAGWAHDDVDDLVSVFADGGEYVDFAGHSVPEERMAWFVEPLTDEVAGTSIVGDVTWLGADDDGRDVYGWVQQFDWVGDDPGTFRGAVEMDVDGDAASRIEWVSDVYGVSGDGSPPAMEDENLGVATAPVVVDGIETTVYNGTPVLGRLLAWGFDRFELAGLEPPAISSVTFTEFSDFCEDERGHVVTTPSGAEVTLCFHEDGACTDGSCEHFVPGVAAVVLHELAHVWMNEAVDGETRRAFLDELGLEVWADRNVPWVDRGVETAADTLAWGLMDRDIVMLRIGQPSSEQLTTWYRILTGADPLPKAR